MMESWKLVLRTGFLPLWKTEVLERAVALMKADSPFLTQGSTTTPPPLMCVQDWPAEACDIVAYCSVDDAFSCTVGQVEEGFAKSCFGADTALGEPAACRWFLHFWDDTPRGECFRLVIEEFERELESRRAAGKLDPALQLALLQFPNDLVLKGACADWLRERGMEAEADALAR